MGKQSTLTDKQKWFRGGGRLLVLIFGLAGLVFVAGMVGVVGYVLVNQNSYLYAYSVPGLARLFLWLPYLLLLLALGIMATTIFMWRQPHWSKWDKAYYSFLAVCAAGYVWILTLHEFIF